MFLSLEDSLGIIERDHRRNTLSCCPEIPSEIPEKVEGWDKLVGEDYPVIYDTRHEFIDMMWSSVLYKIGDFGYDVNRFLSLDFTSEEYIGNMFNKDNWKLIQEIFAKYQAKLLKRSPKVVNFIQSIATYADVPMSEVNGVISFFNDRGKKLDDMQLVLTTEPHRIAGMSAYGKFTSCQDWEHHNELGETHIYSHGAWASLQDPTVGVAFIRNVNAVGPEDGGKDMLARSLIRVLPLDNGVKVVYQHRVYGFAPYVQYLRSSLEELSRNLPEGYIWVDLETSIRSHSEGKTQAGLSITGYEEVSFKLPELGFTLDCDDSDTCYECEGDGYYEDSCEDCRGRGYIKTEEPCDECDGTGYCDEEHEEECEECNGSGIIEVEDECEECDGSGEIREECNYCGGEGGRGSHCIALPYNDHDDWIDFYESKIEFSVPKYALMYFAPKEVREDEIA